MKAPQCPDQAESSLGQAADGEAPSRVFSAAIDGLPADSPQITQRVDEYRLRIMHANAEHGALPFFLATLSFAAVFANFGEKWELLLWGTAVLLVGGVRMYLVARFWQSSDPTNHRWVRRNVFLLACLGCLFGITPFWLPIGGDLWLLAVANLWLAGLAVAVLLSQGIFTVAGLAFAVPAVAPLLCLLLFSGDATQILIGLGNALLFTYLCTAIRRTRTAILDEARYRVRFEQLAEQNDKQRRRSEKLVEELTAEIERRKTAEVALREARDAAETISHRDHLTNLANRREFDGVLAREWLRALRSGSPLSLIICDIDSFRSYNEHYGNHAGDQCLVHIGRVIQDISKRAGDLAARYSGEQFYILLPDTTEEAALDMAESIRQAIHDKTILHPGALVERVVTASFGVATLIPSDSTAQQELVETADHALRRAKRGGGNCVFAIYGEMANDEI